MKKWKNISLFWRTQIALVVLLLTGIVFTAKVDKASSEARKAEAAALAVEVNKKYHQVDGTVEMVQVLPGDIQYAFSSDEQTLLWYTNAKVRLADGKAYIVRLPSDSKALVGSTVKVWVGPNGVLGTTRQRCRSWSGWVDAGMAWTTKRSPSSWSCSYRPGS